MFKYLFYLLFLNALFLSTKGQVPTWQWANSAVSPNNEVSNDVWHDNTTGNVYIGGYYEGGLSAVYGTTFSSTYGGKDAFIGKYTNLGVLVWAIRIGGGGNEEIRGITTDPSGNIYVTGYFSGTCDFDPSGTTANLTALGSQDAFLAKYSPSGSLLWKVKIGGSNSDDCYRVHCDGSNLFLAGYYEGACVFNSTDASTKVSFATQAQNNFFGVKYNFTGVAQWAVSGGSTKDDIGFNVVADASNVYFTGIYYNNLTMYDASGTSTIALQQNGGSSKPDMFVVAYTQAGGHFWQTNAASNEDDYSTGLAQDATGLYICGSIKGNASFPYPSPIFTKACVGGTDVFLAKLLKANGVYQWVSSETGSGSGDEAARCVKYNALNNTLLMTGYFKNSLNFTAYGGSTLISAGNEDVFLASFTTNGNYQWITTAGSTGSELVNSSCIDNLGNVYLAGEYGTSISFGSNVVPTGANKNIFLVKSGCTPAGTNNISAAQTVCESATPAALTGAVPTGGPFTYLWEQSSDNIIWSNASGTNNTQNYNPPLLSNSTYYRRKATQTAGCGNVVNSLGVLITIDSSPTIANAGITQSVCAVSATLNGNSVAVGTGLWSLLSGTSTIAMPSNSVTAVNGLSQGANNYLWSVSNGVCSASSQSVSIFRFLPPSTSNAGINQTICSSVTVLNGNPPTIGSGMWSVASGTANISNASLSNSSLTAISVGTTQLVWTISTGLCPSNTSTVTVVRDAMPTIAFAGNNQTLCATTTTLQANVPLVGTGIWSVATGSGNLSSNTNASVTVSGLVSGANSWVWTISNGVCPASSHTINIFAGDAPTAANAGVNQTICSSVTTLSANIPSNGNGLWSVMSGGATISNTSSSNSSVLLGAGQNILVWTISSGTTCAASTASVTITRDLPPDPSFAGNNETVCGVTSTISANNPTTGLGTWITVSGLVTISNSLNYNTTVSGLLEGDNFLIWQITNGVCAPTSDTIKIISNILPIANAGADMQVCRDTVKLNAFVPNAGAGLWSLSSGSVTILNTSSPSTTIANLDAGNNVLRWSVSNGVCPLQFDEITVKRYFNPSIALAGPDMEIERPIFLMAAIEPTVGNGKWSLIKGVGDIISITDPLSQIRNIGVGENIFRWTTSNGTCEDKYDDVIINMKELQIPNAFSPDGDAINDNFVIPNIDLYDQVDITVLNGWGGVVYSNKSYKNNWNGKNMSGDNLADDTYYYVLELQNKKSNGFIVLKRIK
jgi:gliding motility-associated-like protein